MTNKRVSPDWALEPLDQFLDNTEQLARTFHISKSGIRFLVDKHKLVEALSTSKRLHEKPIDPHHRDHVREDADLAIAEIDGGFPVLCQQASVLLWSYLESTVRNTLRAWLANKPELLTSAAFERIKVPIAEYERQANFDRSTYIVELLEREFAVGKPYGPARFEALLAAIGLDGPMPEKFRRDLFEFGQVRNALAHLASSADKRLADSCPWLQLSPGDPIKMNRTWLMRYVNASYTYVLLLIGRTGQKFGRDFKVKYAELERDYSRGLPDPCRWW